MDLELKLGYPQLYENSISRSFICDVHLSPFMTCLRTEHLPYVRVPGYASAAGLVINEARPLLQVHTRVRPNVFATINITMLHAPPSPLFPVG
jgi:hypothetical protein